MTYANGGSGRTPSDGEVLGRVFATAIVCGFVLLVMQVGSCGYEKVILPQRMADKGYCQQAALARSNNENHTYAVAVWRPCQEKVKVE
jgi:hypothetical protein